MLPTVNSILRLCFIYHMSDLQNGIDGWPVGALCCPHCPKWETHGHGRCYRLVSELQFKFLLEHLKYIELYVWSGSVTRLTYWLPGHLVPPGTVSCWTRFFFLFSSLSPDRCSPHSKIQEYHSGFRGERLGRIIGVTFYFKLMW